MTNVQMDAAQLCADSAGSEIAEALAAARAGGKRLRPRIVEHVALAFGGADDTAVAAVAESVEWLHTAFVVHDDVIDRDDVRRGAMSVPGRFLASGIRAGADEGGARAYAVAGAVLTGDLALAAAYRTLALAPLDPPVMHRLFAMADDALATSAKGELADVRLSVGSAVPTLKDVLRMEEDKTAAYTFCFPMAAGALLGGASDASIEAVRSVGRLLGLGFQLRDDLDGMFAADGVFPEKATSDLREGKMTALMIHASQTDKWSRISAHLGDPDVTTAGLEQVRHALEASGSRVFVEELVSGLEERALALGRDRQLPPQLIPGILALCERPHQRGAA